MADEPVLCFDGDGAGRRAAYRAVDLALPHINPGKTVKFALLPEGQDPDDLVRSGGREAISEVIGAARPVADMLWQRETEAGGFDTPERRAGLDQRVAEVTNVIGDPSVRKYYRQDLDERVRALFAPAARDANMPRWERSRFGEQSRWQGKGRQGRRPAARAALGAPSTRLATSQIVRGARTVLPSREALILLAAINHPWLLETHAEDLAELEFRQVLGMGVQQPRMIDRDRKSTRLNSSHLVISYAVFCLKKKKHHQLSQTAPIPGTNQPKSLAETSAAADTALSHSPLAHLATALGTHPLVGAR